MNAKNKKEKAIHTDPHFTYNEPDLTLGKKVKVYILNGVPVSTFLKGCRGAFVIEPVKNKCTVSQVVEYYRTIEKLEFVVVTNDEMFADSVFEQMSSTKLDIHLFSTKEKFSFDDTLKMYARMFTITNKTRHRTELEKIVQARMGVEESEATMARKLSGYGVDADVAVEIMSSKNSRLEEAVQKNLFFDQFNNLSNIINVSNLSEIDRNGALALKAMAGLGKQTLLTDPMTVEAIESGENVTFFSPLRAINRKNDKVHEHSGKGFTSYDAGHAAVEMYAQALSVCAPSLSRRVFLNHTLGSELVIGDEIEAILRNNLIPSYSKDKTMTPKERELLFDALVQVISRAKNLILTDADISPITARFLAAIRPDIKIYNIEPDYSHITASVASKEIVLNEAFEAVKKCDKKVVVMFDSIRDQKAFLKRLKLNEETALEVGFMVINSETSDNKPQVNFMREPNHELIERDYQGVFCSPTTVRGVSVTHHVCDKVFIISNGVLPPADLVQFPRRFRTATEFVYGLNTRYQIHQDYLEPFKSKKFVPTFERMQAEYMTEHELLTSNIAITLPATLKALKFNLVEHPSLALSEEEEKEMKDDLKELENEAQAEEIALICSAKQITEAEADCLKRKKQARKGLTRRERFSLEKFTIQQKTGIERITEAEVQFCKDFSISVYHAVKEPSSLLAVALEGMKNIRGGIETTAEGCKGKLADSCGYRGMEFVVTKQRAAQALKIAKRDTSAFNKPLPRNLRITTDTTVYHFQKLISVILLKAGYETTGKRDKRVIEGRSLNAYVFKESKYVRYIKNYLK
ncbi:hypothetical protein [Vibrio natriegens]|uniref:hypothetical protein n=1 Tax=Vibrio natriegens TaxID=691 RepID=UPI003B591379